MKGNLEFWSEHAKYKDSVLFITCDSESPDREMFEKYNVKTTPTFLLIRNNGQVAPPVTEYDVRRRKIEDIMDGFLQAKT